MKKVIAILIFALPFSVLAQNIWITQKPTETVTSSGTFIEMGTKTRGIAFGTEKTSNGNGPYCFVTVDGMTWNNCSANMVGGMKFVLPARILPDGKLVGVISEMQGMSILSSFIHSDDLVNILPVYFFDRKDKNDITSNYPESLFVMGQTVFLGTKNGTIKRSEDLGKTWENITVGSNSDLQISVITFTDELNGYAAGGELGEETDYNDQTVETVLEKGSIYKTSDGGKTWTPMVENLEMFPLNIIEGANGRLFLMFYDDETIADPNAGSKRFVWSDDEFASFNGFETSFNITVPSGTFYSSTILDVDKGKNGEIWISGGCGSGGFDYKACTVYSTDGGETWMENLVPGVMKLGPISVLDNDHVYIAGEFKAVYKWGDPNEDLTETEEPDEIETPDEAAIDDEETVDETEETSDDNEEVDNNETVDEEIPVDEAGCSCSMVM